MLYFIYIITGGEVSDLLTLSSYNCKGLGEDKYKVIHNLFDSSTFVLIQEHWHYERKFIEKIKCNFTNVECAVASPMNEEKTNIGRGHGGVAILWKSNVACKIEIIKCISKRICAIKVRIDDFSCNLINVYMPTDPGAGNYDIRVYKEVLDEISTIMLNSDTQIAIIGGDFNSDISRNNHVQTNTFLSYLETERLSLCLNSQIANIPYTFHMGDAKSTIDHFIVTNNLFSCISRYESLFLVDDFSDHIPIKLALNINVCHYEVCPRTYIQSTAWHKCTSAQKQEYVNELDRLLLQINIQSDAIGCTNVNCDVHTDCIKKLYTDIVKFCLEADLILPNTSSNDNNNNTDKKRENVAGWNEFVREHRDNAMYWHQYWLDQGRPPDGNIALNRRLSRARYHCAVRFVNKEKHNIRSSRMAEAISKTKITICGIKLNNLGK